MNILHSLKLTAVTTKSCAYQWYCMGEGKYSHSNTSRKPLKLYIDIHGDYHFTAMLLTIHAHL